MPTGLQNRVAVLIAVGGFDSHMFPPKIINIYIDFECLMRDVKDMDRRFHGQHYCGDSGS